MASFREITGKKGTTYQVTIRLGKYKTKPLIKSFTKKTIANQWASKMETEIRAGKHIDMRGNELVFVRDMLTKYNDDYVSTLARTTQENQGYVIDGLKTRFHNTKFSNFDAQYIYESMKVRLQSVSADTVIKELTILTGLFKFAQMDWRLPVKQNEAREARSMLSTLGFLKGSNIQRVNRVSDHDYDLIRNYRPNKFTLVKWAALFKMETGMRRTELCQMEWSDVKKGYYELPKEKSDSSKRVNRKGRIVPLTIRARAVLWYVKKITGNSHGYIWEWRDPKSLSRAMKRMCDRLSIEGLRLHDLRHEFGSQQADASVDIRISAAAMGHSDLRSVARYSHPDLKKLGGAIKGRK
jgi:integrase